ncbi:MAG: glycerol kinase GlpK [Saprospiraceae bacterium]|nr:glycerol kinase GlpK [Saprospiraceae bacterium]
MKQYILSIDQGTSSTKTLIFNAQGQVVAKGSEPLQTLYLKDGFVEQDPEGIYQNVLISVEKCLNDFENKSFDRSDIKACGISNQRETFVIWDKNGKPLHNAVVWQCKRSISICERLKKEGFETEVKEKTGLIIDPYFSGTKLLWLYENTPSVQEAILAGEAYFGTVDTWILYKLTKGQSYFTDYTNASRTLFFNLKTLDWDRDLLKKWGLETLNLPELKPSAAHFGESRFENLFDTPLSISSMIGDSHAAVFGEGCFEAGTAKATMGTGCSILMNIGNTPKLSENGMLTTICWSIEGRVDYAFEGAIVSCGATIEWLKNEMGLFKDSRETEAIATSVADNNGVYLIPAFSGLGAPHWDMNRKASISGLTFDCTKNHIVRAALESIPYQIKDVILAMEQDAALPLSTLNTDGGITSNTFIMQFLADLLGISIENIGIGDVSALGVAYLAGLKIGVYKDLDTLKSFNANKTNYIPQANRNSVLLCYEAWTVALKNGKSK